MSEIQLILAESTEHDVSFLHRCYTSKDIRGPFQPCRYISEERVKEEIEGSLDMRRFVFIVKQDMSAVGYAYAHYIPTFDHYEIGATLLPSMRDRGIGTAAHRLLVRQLFGAYGARRLHAFVSTENIAEITVLEKCGFVREGVLRKVGNLEGIWHNLVLYGFLSSEFLGVRL